MPKRKKIHNHSLQSSLLAKDRRSSKRLADGIAKTRGVESSFSVDNEAGLKQLIFKKLIYLIRKTYIVRSHVKLVEEVTNNVVT